MNIKFDVNSFVPLIKNLVPVWSNKFVTFFSLSNEYSMILTFIIGMIIDFAADVFTTQHWIATLGTIFMLLVMTKIKLPHYVSSFFTSQSNSITFIGNESCKEGKDTINYPPIMMYLNNLLIEKFNVNEIKSVKSSVFKYVVVSMENTCIDTKKQIYVCVERKKATQPFTGDKLLNKNGTNTNQHDITLSDSTVVYTISGKTCDSVKQWIDLTV